MKIVIIFMWFAPFIHAFFNINLTKKSYLPIQHFYDKSELLCNHYKKEPRENLLHENLLQIIAKKRIGFLKIIRHKNILPTFFLCFSGGWIMCPSWVGLWSNPHFLVTTIITILVMSTSMIINDLFDLDIENEYEIGRFRNKFISIEFANVLEKIGNCNKNNQDKSRLK